LAHVPAAAGFSAASGSLRYLATVFAYSNVKLVARLTQDSLEPGATLMVTATLTQSSLPIEGTASLSAELTRPDGSVTTLAMTQVESGRWQLQHPATQPGVYRFRVMAVGRTVRGQRFTREQVVTGAVWRGGDTTPEDPHGGPRDPVVDLLCCIFRSGVLDREALNRLERWGIDTKRLLACVEKLCARR
jgi:hypothetical protein